MPHLRANVTRADASWRNGARAGVFVCDSVGCGDVGAEHRAHAGYCIPAANSMPRRIPL